MDVIEEDLKRTRANGWRNIIHDREKWREVLMTVKNLVEQIKSEEKDKRVIRIKVKYINQ